jgi:hypothetical protein
MPTLDNLVKLKSKNKKTKQTNENEEKNVSKNIMKKEQNISKKSNAENVEDHAISAAKLQSSKEIIESRVLKEEKKKKNYEKSTKVNIYILNCFFFLLFFFN